MKQLVLALNSGSSSLKASLLEGKTRIMSCHAEMLGTPTSVLKLTFMNDELVVEHQQPNLFHDQALQIVVDKLRERDLLQTIVAVGHRVVHGGTLFKKSAVMDDEALNQLDSIQHLAPLHNPANVSGIRWMRNILPQVPSIAVFDTSFHSSISEKAYTYPLPSAYRALHMRKFGFHGTSVNYVCHRATEVLQTLRPHQSSKDEFNMVICHLGSGASVTAVVGEKSTDTSMGFTPLAGLMMGTRCGSVDPSLVEFACDALGKTVHEVMIDFNTNAGLKGMVDGNSYDMRALLQRQHDDKKAALAVDMFVYRLAQHIASAMVALQGPLDALVFTAGIGEHSAEIRRRTMEQLKYILPQGQLDDDRNNVDGHGSLGIISKEGLWPLVLEIPTDEEAMIGRECLLLIKN